ncbi:glyoxylase-like metal-dependent hydrolase (beta-lactamase superfamily II) [Solirubrobacter pauli]|uniref:Glyoxylase-like metal-dependent hydrolase (Beta-lactamase superfamily II) n=1 Tax=Solirubrobacter pauli TaxID=166793 RepID=A0A660LH87_9ACTN|nr:MBL fold metallo-hydrolase [Solirubrobacter pauli]RKQ93585.1 glyoxylase-like metal-dependent hydrolase (beta-lactamase superfamily II) [Solirubrobacter pauli]
MITRIRADNPSPLTLSGTNTYVVDGWVVDPGPLLEPHLAAVTAAVGDAPAGIVLTHSHADHSEAAGELAERLGVAVVDVRDGDTIGPFTVMALPGHADDHVVFVAGAHAFTGDAVLGEGSVFVSGRLIEYLDGLRRLRALDLRRIHPGHGDEIDDPAAKLDEYLAHRLERERKLLAALESGIAADDEDALLDAAWTDAPAAVRPFAAITLRAHLAKLQQEGNLGV